MSSVDEIMASLLGSPSKTKSQNGVVKVKYNANKKSEAPTSVQTRQGRSQTRTSMVPPPQKSSLASQIMASRASSTPPSPIPPASPAPQQTPQKLTGFGRGKQFSDVQKKRLAEELAKHPEMTLYFKKKVASQLSKEIGLGEKQIISWFSNNQRKGNFDKPSLTPQVQTTPSVEIKKETPDSALVANEKDKPKFSSSADIECIDIDDDDDLLLNESVLDESVTIEESKTIDKNHASNEKAKSKHEESSKDEIVHLLMDQIKELEKFVQTNSSPELEKSKKQMKEKVVEIEKLRNDIKSKNENLQSMVKTSEDQEQRFAQEFKSLKDEIEKLKSNKRSTTTEDSNAVKVFKQRISELEAMIRSKDEDHYILKNKLDLVENVANNKVKMYKEKLEETEKSKSSDDQQFKKKYESLQKDYSEKVDVVKSLESRIPKMIEEFTKYVEEKDSLHIIKEKEFAKAMSDKQKEIVEANDKMKNFSTVSQSLAEKNQEIQLLKQREKEMKEISEKKQVGLMNNMEKKERVNLESQENLRKIKVSLVLKEKELEKKVKELQEKSTEFDHFKLTQVGLNEKYKKLLVNKEKELDQAEKVSLELKERIKKFKEEHKLKRNSETKELVDMKEMKKKLKKDNDLKDKEIELKSKQLSKLEGNVKDTTEKISKLQEKNKALEKIVTNNDANFQKQKIELSYKVEEITTLQVTTQKLTKLNNEMKNQYNELNKIYNKSVIESKRNEKLVNDKTEEITAIQKTASLEKETLEAEIKTLKEDSVAKEEKINKLLDVLVKRGDHIRELKTQDAELTKKLKEKEDQYVDLVGRYNKKVKVKDADLEVKTKELVKTKAVLQSKEQEIVENNESLKYLRNKLSNCEKLVQDNSIKFMEQIQSKVKEVAAKSYSMKKEMQKLILDCNEKLDSKDQLLREKALEHGRKLLEKTTELSSKIKEKELLLLNLNARIFEKDGIIFEKDKALKMSSTRIQEMKKGFEKDLEERAFADINTQNNIRHELLVQQQQMKRQLLEEQKNLKKYFSLERDLSLKQFEEESSKMKMKCDVIQESLARKIKEKQVLVRKLKNVNLYKPATNVGQEKNHAVTSPPLMISFSWPLVHLFGSPESVEEKTPTFLANDNLVILLQFKTASLKNSLPLFVEEKRTGHKRKFQEDGGATSSNKKHKLTPKLLMLSYSWPLVSCEPKPDATFLLNDAGAMLLNLRLRFPSLKDLNLPSFLSYETSTRSNKRKNEEDCDISVSKKQRIAPEPLMLTYSWPMVSCQPNPNAIFLLNDNGAMLLNLRLKVPSLMGVHLPSFPLLTQESRSRKRKFEEECEGTVSKKQRDAPTLLMLTYSWPMVSCQPNPDAISLLNNNGAMLLNLRLKVPSLMCVHLPSLPLLTQESRSRKRKFEEECEGTVSKKQRDAPTLLMLTYSWPMVSCLPKPDATFLLNDNGAMLLRLKQGSIKDIEFLSVGYGANFEVDLLEKDSSFGSSSLALPRLTYDWPVVVYQPKPCSEVGMAATVIPELKFPTMMSPEITRIFKRKSEEELKVISKNKIRVNLDASSPLMLTYSWPLVEFKKRAINPFTITKQPVQKRLALAESCELASPVNRENIIKNLNKGVKRKVLLDYSDLEPENKRLKSQEFEEIPSFYAYKFAKPMVKSTCLSSPGLCSPRKVVTRVVKLPLDLEEELLEDNANEAENVLTEEESSDDEFEEAIFSTPVAKKTKCLRSPGLCNTFPKVTVRSFPSSLRKLLDEENYEPEENDEPELNGNSIFDTELWFRTPKHLKTKCLSSPGLCDTAPIVTNRSIPVSYNELFEEENSSEDESDDDSEVSFTTPDLFSKTKCTRTPGLGDIFPRVTDRSLPPSLAKYLEETLGSDDLECGDDNLVCDYDLDDEVGNSSGDEIDEVFSEESDDEISIDRDFNILHSVFTLKGAVEIVDGILGEVFHSGEVVAAEVIEETVDKIMNIGEAVAIEVTTELVEKVMSLGEAVIADVVGETVENVSLVEAVRKANAGKFRISVSNRPRNSRSL